MNASDLPPGTVRRCPPGQGFAHAMLLDQLGSSNRWLVVDLYGPMPGEELCADDDVHDWPVVYVPTSDDEWTNPSGGRRRES